MRGVTQRRASAVGDPVLAATHVALSCDPVAVLGLHALFHRDGTAVALVGLAVLLENIAAQQPAAPPEAS